MDDQTEQLLSARRELESEWLHHPVTETVAAGLDEETRLALVEVVGTSRLSTDPACVRAVTKYDALKRFAKTMKGEQ